MIEILVVEDDAVKAERVQEALNQVEGVFSEAVTVVQTVGAAKRALTTRRFDLVVLDIALPYVERGEVARDAGVKLLEEVLARPDVYATPTHFVGITGFREVYDAYSGRFASGLWTLALYVPGESEWADCLRARTRHTINASRALDASTVASADCCILTALHQPELTQVLALPFDWEQESLRGDDTLYWGGTISCGSRSCRVVACSCARMGMPATAVAAAKLIHSFRPRVLVMCGIMAGLKKRTSIGDVVVSTLCWDWGNGKWIRDSEAPTFLPAPHQIGISVAVRERVRVFASDGALLAPSWSRWKGRRPETPPRLLMGPTASGAAVLADGATISGLVRQHRELRGIDMELYGALVAAEEAPRPRPHVVGVKAVVDFADGAKSDDYQEYAAFISAETVRLMMPTLLEGVED
jgi:nucleoside phosphorylase